MFTINQLKERGKQAYKKNFWRAVLVALIISVIGGTQGTGIVEIAYSGIISMVTAPLEYKLSTGSPNNSRINGGSDRGSIRDGRGDHEGRPKGDIGRSGNKDGIDADPFESFLYGNDGYFDSDDFFDDGYYYDYDDSFEDWYDDDVFEYGGNDDRVTSSDMVATAAVMAVILVALIFAVAVIMVIALLFRVFFFNPLEIGCMKFFVSNLTEDGTVSSLGYAFDHRYKNQIYIMFLRSLFTFLWGLLFVIPGIYKSYEYRLIPYLLAEYPDLEKDRAFAISKQMMYGYKMKAFLLDLSFFGWWLLNTLTLGLLGIFFVGPYYHSTAAAFYEALKGFHGIPGLAAPMWTNEMQGEGDAQTTEVTYEAALAEEGSSDTQEKAGEEAETNAFAAAPAESGSESFGETTADAKNLEDPQE